MTADDTSELKAAIDAAALRAGFAADLAERRRTAEEIHLDYRGRERRRSRPLWRRLAGAWAARGCSIGRASGASATANVRWTHLFQDRSSEYSGTLEGVNRAADIYAGHVRRQRQAVPVDIEVSGLNDLRDYASLESYLESLTFISHVSVESLSGDTVRFRLATRGGA